MTSSMGCGISGYTSSIVPSYTSNYNNNSCGKTNQMSAVTSSTSSHALTTYDGLCNSGTSGIGNVSSITGTSGVNVSPLPARAAHQMNTMPPLSQVCISI